MTGRRSLTGREAARLREFSGETRRLMGCVNRFVSAAARFRRVSARAGGSAKVAGSLAFRDGAMPALTAAAVLLLMPTAREGDVDRLVRRLENVPEQLGGGGDEELEHLVELLADVVRSGSGRDRPSADDEVEGGGR